jgi:hypothetical protein
MSLKYSHTIPPPLPLSDLTVPPPRATPAGLLFGVWLFDGDWATAAAACAGEGWVAAEADAGASFFLLLLPHMTLRITSRFRVRPAPSPSPVWSCDEMMPCA